MSEVGSYTRGIEDAMHGVAADIRHLNAEAVKARDAAQTGVMRTYHQGRHEVCVELLQGWGLDGG